MEIKNTKADTKTSIEWVKDKTEGNLSKWRKRKKIGEKNYKLVQECIICKQQDFYKEKRKMKGTKKSKK